MTQPSVLYVVTEDWYFRNHRLAHAQTLIAAGFAVHVATRSGGADVAIREAGVQVHDLSLGRSSLSPLATARELRALNGIIRAVQPDIVHGVALKPVLVCALAMLVNRRQKFIFAVSGLGLSSVTSPRKVRLLAGMLRAAARSARVRLLFQNPFDKSAVHAREDRTTLIPGVGVDARQFTVVDAPAAPPWRFVFLGRAVTSKGLSRFPEAAARLAQRGHDVVFDVYCTVDETSPGALPAAEVERIAHAPGVVWHGPTSSPEAALQAAHAAVLPTEGGEGVSKFVLESLACGRAVLTTTTPGSEVVIDGETGILFAPQDTDALVGAVEKFIGLTDGARTRMIRRCREDAELKYSLKVIAPRIVELHRTLAAK